MNQRAPTWAPVVAVGVMELLMWMFRQRVRVRVEGDSMRPTLHNDTYVLVERTTHAGPGDIVLCRHPYRRDVHILKRVATTSDVGMHLLGDNPPASTDSSSFGEVPWAHLVGVVTAQMK